MTHVKCNASHDTRHQNRIKTDGINTELMYRKRSETVTFCMYFTFLRFNVSSEIIFEFLSYALHDYSNKINDNHCNYNVNSWHVDSRATGAFEK